jgi:hypothetical protein
MYLLLVAILISGNGVVLAIHTCLSTSSKSISLFEEKSCCEKEDSNSCNNDCEHDVKSDCCSSELKYQKLNTPFILEKVKPVITSGIYSLLPVFECFIPKTEYYSVPFQKPHIADIPVTCSQLLI